MAERLDVCIEWAGATVEVGALYPGDRSGAVGFEYAREWLARSDAFAVDPVALPLRPGVFHASELPGAFADLGPDRWGRIVIDRSVRQGLLDRRPYRAIDYLLAIEDEARVGQGNRILIGLFSRRNSFQDIVTPACLESFAPNRAIFHGSVSLGNRERQPPKGAGDFGGVAAADSALVLSEGDVKGPVQ